MTIPSGIWWTLCIYAKKNLSAQSARNRLAAYQFQGEDVFKSVSVLSGGEQSRLRLCMLMDEEINFLILDEPTNHLDIDSREWIEEAVEAFDGTLLFVSHDRYFINRFATRIWELEDGVISDYRCGFAQYRQLKAEEAKEKPQEKAPEKAEKPREERTERSRGNQGPAGRPAAADHLRAGHRQGRGTDGRFGSGHGGRRLRL